MDSVIWLPTDNFNQPTIESSRFTSYLIIFAICFSCWFSCCILFHMSRRNNRIICFFLACSQQNATITLNKHDKFVGKKAAIHRVNCKDAREKGICVINWVDFHLGWEDFRSGLSWHLHARTCNNPNRSAVCNVVSFVCRVLRIERNAFILMLSQLKAVNAPKRHCVWLHAIMLYSCSVKIFFFTVNLKSGR